MKSNFAAIKRIIKELNAILTNSQKKKAVLLFGIILVSSWFELLGVTSILPFMQAIVTPDVIMNNRYFKPFIHMFNISNSKELMVLLALFLILIYIVKNAYMLFASFIQFSFSTRVVKELAVKMLRSYMGREYTFFLDTNSAEILRGCNGDVDSVHIIIENIFSILTQSLNILFIGIFIIYTDPAISISTIILMGFIAMIVVLLLKPVMKRMGEKSMQAQSSKNKAVTQTVMGVKELFVMQRKELFIKEYERAADDYRRLSRNFSFLNSTPDRILEGICVSGLIGIVVIRLMADVDMMAFMPKLGVFAMASFKMLPAVGKISSCMASTMYQLPMLENVYSNVMEAEKYESEQKKIVQREGKGAGVREFKTQLSVKNVYWQYKGQNKAVLENAEIDITKGESVALIGPSGAGKTTLSDIILGLLHPQKGGVYMDGIDVHAIPDEWAKIVGYVPQTVFLIDDTVRSNITFGLQVNDDKKVWEALEKAQLREFVEKLPNGLDTVVGERGVKFSGGQRQRIAIARALFNDPEILVLDEATAALDGETENAVMEAIDSLKGKITLIIVAHRLTTIRNCDKIYEIADGRAREKNKKEVLEKI